MAALSSPKLGTGVSSGSVSADWAAAANLDAAFATERNGEMLNLLPRTHCRATRRVLQRCGRGVVHIAACRRACEECSVCIAEQNLLLPYAERSIERCVEVGVDMAEHDHLADAPKQMAWAGARIRGNIGKAPETADLVAASSVPLQMWQR